MLEKTCKQCGKSFSASEKRAKFCSLDCCWRDCYGQWRRDNRSPGQFKKGKSPGNKGTSGVMQANSGSFQGGVASARKKSLGSVTVRVDKSGRKRAWG